MKELIGCYEILKDFALPAVALISLFVGLNTFSRWKRERLEEKRIDVAIEALAIAFEACSAFDIIRARLIKRYETDQLRTTHGIHTEEHTILALLKRVEAQQPFFDKALALEPRFVAVFGTNATFERLFAARREVIVTADAFLFDLRTELEPVDTEARAQRVKWRKQLFASPGVVDVEDEVGKTLQRFRDDIEKLCRPIVQHTFDQKKPLKRWLPW